MVQPGARLGPYEIVSRLGAGGMGVVFVARDTHLQRTVALKVLGERLAHTESSDRLLQEARAASGLNHPNICTVHEVREEAGHAFIVMEYVEGRPLYEQIPTGGMPIDIMLRYAGQIADALAHAHDRGILHRDLKSANIIVTPEGRAKIVDFGLASRLAHADESATRPAALPGESAPLAGTIAYLAPEVIHGDQPSVASDIWSVGVLLFEMATGTLPYGGRTVFDVTAAILREPVPAMPMPLPPSVRTIVARCLAKAPAQRYHTAHELRAALEAVQSDASIVPVRPRLPRRGGAIIVAAGAIAVLIAALSWSVVRRRPAQVLSGTGRLALLISSERELSDPALSPDGTMLTYVAEDDAGRRDLFVSRVAGGGRVRLTNDDARETHPRFSPDGDRIAFARRGLDGTGPDICVMPALGGQSTVIAHAAAQPVWSPDGRRIAFIRYTAGNRLVLATADADGTDVRDLVPGDGAFPFIRKPAWSPDGRLIAFVRGAGGVAGEIWLVRADDGRAATRLSSDAASASNDDPAFSADGRAIVHSSNRGGATNIWMVPIAGGTAQRLTTGPGPDESPTVDARGHVAFLNSRWRNELIAYELSARTSRTLLRHAPYLWAPALAPSSREIAFSRSEVDGSWHVWAADLDGGTPRQLTYSERGEVYPRWAPDGRSLIFNNWSTPRRIWRVSRDGGPPAPLTPPEMDAAYGDLSPDGRTMAFAAVEGGQERVYIAPVANASERRLLRKGTASVPRWSPDGAWIAFAPDRGYESGVYIAHPDGTGERQLTTTGGWPVWWPDGRRIGYVTVSGDLNQQIQTIALGAVAAADVIPIRFGGANFPFDVSPDGKLLATTNSVHISSEIWVAELRP